MSNQSKSLLGVGLLLAVLLSVSIVFAGPKGDRKGNGKRDRSSKIQGESQRGNEGMLQKRLGLSDEQWKSFEPKLKKVRELSRSLKGGAMPRKGRDGDGERRRDNDGEKRRGHDGEDNEITKASKELRSVLRNAESKPEDITAKLSALRSARETAKNELLTAQNDLKTGLTVKQEATLVMMNMIE